MSAPGAVGLMLGSQLPVQAIKQISAVSRKLPEILVDPLRSLVRADRAFNQPSLSLASKGISLLTAA